MKACSRIVLLVVTGSALFSQTAMGETKKTEAMTGVPKKIVYKIVGDVELRLDLFEAQSHDAATAAPAMVFFFGGGWRTGSPKQFYEHCKYYAARGVVAMSAEYRVKNKHGTTPIECIKDGKSAIRWVRAHASELGVDPNRIIAGGGSAGGYVAAATGVLEGVEEEGEDLNISSMPNAMVLFNPVTDTTEIGYGSKRFGARPEEFSPAHQVRKGLPPAIIFHGTADTTVPFENTQRFCDLMKHAGNICELVPFEGKPHGFFNPGRDATSYPATLQATDKFLASIGFLPPRRSPEPEGEAK